MCSYTFTLHSDAVLYLYPFIAMGPFESLLIPTGPVSETCLTCFTKQRNLLNLSNILPMQKSQITFLYCCLLYTLKDGNLNFSCSQLDLPSNIAANRNICTGNLGDYSVQS